MAPYPLEATARVIYQGADLEIRKVVQSSQRVEGIGIVQNPLIVAPAVSVSVSPSGGAIPLGAGAFQFSCTLHSNVKGEAKGVVRLKLPPGWKSTPSEYAYSLARDGENETVAFQVAPQNLKPQAYEIRAEAELAGKRLQRRIPAGGLSRRCVLILITGPPLIGCRPWTSKPRPVFTSDTCPGTGDDVPRALQDLGLPVQMLTAS